MKIELEKKLIEKYPGLLRNYGGDPRETCLCFGIECNDGWYQIIDHCFGYLVHLMKSKISVDYTKEYKNKYKDDKDFYKKYFSYTFLPPHIILDQIKEKFGTLRVYYHIDYEFSISQDIWPNIDVCDYDKKINKYLDKIDNAIDYAEYQTSITCEVTGKEGKLRTAGWHVVLCDEEFEKRNAFAS